MKRREKLIASALNNNFGDGSTKALDATLRVILGDMGELYMRFPVTICPGPHAHKIQQHD